MVGVIVKFVTEKITGQKDREAGARRRALDDSGRSAKKDKPAEPERQDAKTKGRAESEAALPKKYKAGSLSGYFAIAVAASASRKPGAKERKGKEGNASEKAIASSVLDGAKSGGNRYRGIADKNLSVATAEAVLSAIEREDPEAPER